MKPNTGLNVQLAIRNLQYREAVANVYALNEYNFAKPVMQIHWCEAAVIPGVATAI